LDARVILENIWQVKEKKRRYGGKRRSASAKSEAAPAQAASRTGSAKAVLSGTGKERALLRGLKDPQSSLSIPGAAPGGGAFFEPLSIAPRPPPVPLTEALREQVAPRVSAVAPFVEEEMLRTELGLLATSKAELQKQVAAMQQALSLAEAMNVELEKRVAKLQLAHRPAVGARSENAAERRREHAL